VSLQFWIKNAFKLGYELKLLNLPVTLNSKVNSVSKHWQNLILKNLSIVLLSCSLFRRSQNHLGALKIFGFPVRWIDILLCVKKKNFSFSHLFLVRWVIQTKAYLTVKVIAYLLNSFFVEQLIFYKENVFVVLVEHGFGANWFVIIWIHHAHSLCFQSEGSWWWNHWVDSLGSI